MRFYVMLALAFLVSPVLSLAQGEVPTGLPAAVLAPATGEVNPKEWLHPVLPIFSEKSVSLDSPPEQIEALNNPTWENAHRAAIAKLYRNYKMMLASHMIATLQQALVKDVMIRHGYSQADMLLILETIAKEQGLATYDIRGKDMGLVSTEMQQVIQKIIQGSRQ